MDKRHWRVVILERQETNEVSLVTAPAHCLERASRPWYSHLEPGGHTKRTDRAENPEGPWCMVARIYRTEYQRGKTCIERELQR